jgi:enoyl-CoA hydratase
MVEVWWPKPGMAQLILDRPERGNAFSAELVSELTRAVDQAQAKSDTHTLIFSAKGDDFSTGMDLSGLSQETDESLLERFVAIEDLLARVWASSCRTVAVVSGRAWGAAADLALACDLRLGHASASFRFPGAQFGLVLGSRRLACRIGSDRARQIILHGTTVKAEQALAMGMLQGLVEGFEPADLPTIRVDRETQRHVMAATRSADDAMPGALAQDRLVLMVSAQRPGLKDRMLQYLAAVQASKKTV